MKSATAIANPNIAFIKYWGNRDQRLRIPSNGSISMNLDGLFSRTQVTFTTGLTADKLTINGQGKQGQPLWRVSGLLEQVRARGSLSTYAHVESENNFPTGTGIASSASAFAALTLAACCAAGLQLDERVLSRLARTGSGSACRSVPGGFVEWRAGEDDETSFAHSIAPPEHWDLVDCVAIVSQDHKPTGSYEGHSLADTSPLQAARLEHIDQRLDICRQAILARDFDALALVTELDSNLMNAVILTSTPPLLYWQPATLAVMHAVRGWRRDGLPACYTIDAGPNVHVISLREQAAQISGLLHQIPGVQDVLSAGPGGPAHCVPR